MTKYISRKKAKRIIADSIFKIGFLEDTLKKDYPYILDAINKEDCFLMGDMYQIFKELIYDNKVVGFATYDLGFKDFITLISIYVLPEFRGHQLFLNEIESCDIEFIIKDPNNKIMEILLHYDLANKLSDTLIHSKIKLQMNQLMLKSKEPVEYDNLDAMVYTNLYDLKLESMVCVCNLYNDDENRVIYQDNYDEYNFNVNEHLDDIENAVLDNIDNIDKIKHIVNFDEL